MSTIVQQSTALISLVQGQHLQDVMLLIDNQELYNALPGKLERVGIKTLASWPIFVTAVMNHRSAGLNPSLKQPRQVREAAISQLPIFDLTTTANPSGLKARKRKVEKTLAKLRQLHDELNAELYTHPTERPSIHAPQDAYLILQPFMQALDHEELWVINMDTRNRVMSLVKLYQGSVNTTQVRGGEIFRQAILDNAPAILLAHNHPSGDPTPSPDDIALTRAMHQAGKLLDIDVLDHLVVGAGRFVSLKERGLGFGG